MLGAIKKRLLYVYFFFRNSWIIWFYILNRSARSLQNKRPLPLTPEGTRILNDLVRDGIALTTLDALLLDSRLASEMLTWIQDKTPVENTSSKKKFLREYWPITPPLDLSNPYVRFGLHENVLGIANAYMGMWTRFVQFDLRKTLPTPDSGPVQSQRWHRDPEEKRMLKAFVYLNDVDMDAGPFTFAIKSTYGNAYGHLFPQRPPEGSYPLEEKVREVIPAADIKAMMGKAGTVVLCDTSGLHFGGRAKTKERIMLTVSYSSPAHTEGARYKWTESTPSELKRLSPQAQFALSGRKLAQGVSPMHA